jgi:hypothetical protein
MACGAKHKHVSSLHDWLLLLCSQWLPETWLLSHSHTAGFAYLSNYVPTSQIPICEVAIVINALIIACKLQIPG